MDGYCPAGPYVIRSGERVGEKLELLMFSDYSFLCWLIRFIRLKEKHLKKRNSLHLHLEWLMERGENRRPVMLCPYCHKRPVRYFAVLFGQTNSEISVGYPFTSCEQEGCIKKLGEPTFVLPFRFSSMRPLYVRTKRNQKKVAELFKGVFGLPKHLTAKAAFNFFNI